MTDAVMASEKMTQWFPSSHFGQSPVVLAEDGQDRLIRLGPQELHREWLPGARCHVGILDRGACCGGKRHRDGVGSAVYLERHGAPGTRR